MLEPHKAEQPVSLTPAYSAGLQGVVVMPPSPMAVVSAHNTSTKNTGRKTQKVQCKWPSEVSCWFLECIDRRFIFSTCYIAISAISAIYLVICVSFLMFNTFPLTCDISELIKFTYHEVVSSSCLYFCLMWVGCEILRAGVHFKGKKIWGLFISWRLDWSPMNSAFLRVGKECKNFKWNGYI